jgi:hypothetical protein
VTDQHFARIAVVSMRHGVQNSFTDNIDRISWDSELEKTNTHFLLRIGRPIERLLDALQNL